MNGIIVDIEELRTWCVVALEQAGATTHEANIIFGDYLDAEARGKHTCGFETFPTVLDAFPINESFELIEHNGTVITIDGHRNAGQIVARYGIDLAMETLPNHKLCAIGLKDIVRFNSAGTIAQYAAEQGAIAIVFQYGGTSFTLPTTGKQANLSPNPIGIALPETDPLFVLDISLSQASLGYNNIARFLNRPIEASWDTGAEGQDMLFMDEFTVSTPFAGHTGFDVSLVFQMLSGALLAGCIPSAHETNEQGASILLIHPTIFGFSSETFQKQISAMLSQIAVDDPCAMVGYPQHPNAQYHAILETGTLTLPRHVVREIRKLAS